MTRKILFIENPHSGTSQSKVDEELLQRHFPETNWKLIKTEYPGHARDLALKAKNSFDTIVAIGGDGTINEIASVLVDTKVMLGIVPKGSGNGLSRFLNIPLTAPEALGVIQVGNWKPIDTMSINGHRFVNVAGVGFDGHIAHLFKDFGSRGLISYTRLVLSEFRRYIGLSVEIKHDDQELSQSNLFVLSFANSSQYGNNAHIAPNAIIDDGLVDVCLMKKPSFMQSVFVVVRMFTKRLNNSLNFRTFKASKVCITTEAEIRGHVDGEPINLGREAVIEVFKQNLNVLVP